MLNQAAHIPVGFKGLIIGRRVWRSIVVTFGAEFVQDIEVALKFRDSSKCNLNDF
jgi:hypothetical protein